MLKKDKAICLRTSDYSETSQIVTLFGRETGKIAAIAKGAKRAKSLFGGPIEIFSSGRIVFAESARGKLATLTEFEQDNTFLQLRHNLYAMNSGLFAAELLNALTTEFDPNAELYDCFAEFLQDVQSAGEEPQILALLILFQLNLLIQIGSGLILDRCANFQLLKRRLGSISDNL